MTLRHGTPRHGSTLALRIALTHRHRHTQSQIQTDLPRNLNLILVKIRLTLLFEIPYDLTFWLDTIIRHDAVLICRQPIKIDAANPTCRRKSIFTPQIWLEITQLNDVVCVFAIFVNVCDSVRTYLFVCVCVGDSRIRKQTWTRQNGVISWNRTQIRSRFQLAGIFIEHTKSNCVCAFSNYFLYVRISRPKASNG